MLTAPTPTPYDLHWRMFGIPVRVHPAFWLVGAFTGWSFSQLGFSYLFLWIVCVFVSILVHELGHVFAGMLFGQRGHIVLYSLGGLAIWNHRQTTRWQNVCISFAGPGAGFVFYGLVVIAQQTIHSHDMFMDRWRPELFLLDPTAVTYVGGAIYFLKIINLGWGLVNLLPVYPLDGGQAMREICLGVSPRNGLRMSLGISFLCAGSIAIYSAMKLARPELPYPPFMPQFNIFLFGVMALENLILMQTAEREQRRSWDDGPPW